MKNNVTYEDAMEWLESMKEEYDLGDNAQNIIEYIQEMLWQYNDLRNS